MKKSVLLTILFLCQVVLGEDYTAQCFPYGVPEYAYVTFCGMETACNWDSNDPIPPNGKLFLLTLRPPSYLTYPPACFTYEGNPDGWQVWLVMNDYQKYLYLVRNGGQQKYFGQYVADCNSVYTNELYDPWNNPRVKAVNGKAFVCMPSLTATGLCCDLNSDGIVNFLDWAEFTGSCGEFSLESIALVADNWLVEEE